MKIIGIILATLMLISAVAIDVLAANKTHQLTKGIESVTEGLTAEQKAEVASAAGAPSTGRLKAGMVAGVLAAIASLVLLVTTFNKDASRGAIVAATAGLTLLAIVVYPSIPTGPTDGMGPRPMMIVALVLAAIGAAGSMLAKRRAI
jgi:hypothetical protein